MPNLDDTRRLLTEHRQEHLLTFWERLSPSQRSELLADIAQINWEALEAARSQAARDPSPSEIQPPSVFRFAAPAGSGAAAAAGNPGVDVIGTDRGQEIRRRGRELLTAGRAAALTVAGGQGTRLRFDGPKGMFPITPVRNKTLFQNFAEAILATRRRYGADLAWYIMTSPDNHQATVAYFEQQRFFGLPSRDVFFFRQGTMPALDDQGRILLSERHRVGFAPDGHGGVLAALAAAGGLDDLRRRGIDYVSYFQVDNPLIPPFDPSFLGLVHLERSEAGSKVVPKAFDEEKVGVFGIMNGRLQVIEYSDLPAELARRKHPDGTRVFDCGNIAAHVFAVKAIERWSGVGATALPWHRAHKAIPHVDLTSGNLVQPQQPNATKFEQFIFDTVPLADHPVLLEVDRAEEFSPVKNAEGVDSPHTARQALHERALRWLCQADALTTGSAAPRLVEISPLLALDADQLRERLSGRLPLPQADALYLE